MIFFKRQKMAAVCLASMLCTLFVPPAVEAKDRSRCKELKSYPLSRKDVKARAKNGSCDERYDVIIVGAGTSGSCLIYNFARKFPKLKILVLEAGNDSVQDNEVDRSPQDGPNPNPPSPTYLSDTNDDWGQTPRNSLPLVHNEACYAWQYYNTNSNGQEMNRRLPANPRGSIWGGTSAVNASVWYRGTKDGTYDLWEALVGPDWGYEAMNTAFVKLENRSQRNVMLGGAPKPYFDGSTAANTIYPGVQGRDGQICLVTSGASVGAPQTYGTNLAMRDVMATEPEFTSRFVLDANTDLPEVPETYTTQPYTRYDQSDPNFGTVSNPGYNPYALLAGGGVGSLYIPPADPSNLKGPEFGAERIVSTNPSNIPANGSTGGIKFLQPRSYAAPAFLYPVVTKKRFDAKKQKLVRFPNNVTIKSRAYVTKLIFDEHASNEVVGVEYVLNGWQVMEINRNYRTTGPKALCNKNQTVDNQDVAQIYRAYAAADIFLCGGALESPAILQRNGIGSRDHLESLNDPVDCRVDLPGVGYHLQDHPDYSIHWYQEVNYQLPSGLPMNENYYPQIITGPADRAIRAEASIFGFAPPLDTITFKSDPTKRFNNTAVLPTHIPAVAGVIGGSIPYSALPTVPFLGFPLKVDSLPNYDATQFGSVGSTPGINVAGMIVELMQSEGQGTALIQSGNPFEPVVCAPNITNNENDLQARVDGFQNTLWPLIKKLGTRRIGPSGPGSLVMTNLAGPNNRNFVRMLWPPSSAFLADTKTTALTNPFTTTAASSIVTVAMSNHGFTQGETILIEGASAFANIPADKLNNYHQVTAVLNANSFQIVVDTLGFYNPAVITAAVGGGNVSIKTLAFNQAGFREHLLHNSFEGWHHSGSCKMGAPTDLESVVDTRCRVYGVKGLRVCDASIFPVCPNANTQAACYGVAQHLSDLIKPEYKKLFKD